MILTQQSTKILGIIASILALVIGFMLVLVPAYSKWSENNESIEQAESEVALMQSQRDGFLQAQQFYPELSSIDESLRIRFPEIADNDGIIAQLSAALASSGISSNSLALTFSAPTIMEPTFTEAPPVEEAPVDDTGAPAEEPAPAPAPEATGSGISDMAKMEVAISVKGTDEQITQFLNVLHSSDRAIVVKKFSVQKNEETGVSQLSITSEVYIFAKIPNPSDTTNSEEHVSVDVDDNENNFNGETSN